MKGFIKQLLTNRLGIILAALNVCYFVSRHFITYEFSHGNGNRSYLAEFFTLVEIKHYCSNIMFSMNLPALIVSALPQTFLIFLFSKEFSVAIPSVSTVSLIFFITLQWLFIGWMAKRIASAIQPKQN